MIQIAEQYGKHWTRFCRNEIWPDVDRQVVRSRTPVVADFIDDSVKEQIVTPLSAKLLLLDVT